MVPPAWSGAPFVTKREETAFQAATGMSWRRTVYYPTVQPELGDNRPMTAKQAEKLKRFTPLNPALPGPEAVEALRMACDSSLTVRFTK